MGIQVKKHLSLLAMKKTRHLFNHRFSGAVLFYLFCIASLNATAQRVLSPSETAIIDEAHKELHEAISNPDLSQEDRVKLVERSAKTLKEYGQPPAFPHGSIPLKVFMESNYNQSRREFEDASNLYQVLSSKLLDQQLRIINTLQIEVAEEQIKLMLPGLPAPYELSKELVSTFLKWDIREGVNAGTYGDAQSLVKHFHRLASTKELTKALEELRKGQMISMQMLHRDLKTVDPLEAHLRKRYELAAAGVFVMRGYEGAIIANNQPTQTRILSTKTESQKADTKEDEFRETTYYYRLIETETVKKINKAAYVKSISVSNNAMSASVTPPKPKEPFTTTASWGSPPGVIYPGDVITLSAKGAGDARLRIEGNCGRTNVDGVRVSEGPGSSSVSFKWKFEGCSEPYLYIRVQTLVTGYTWAWTSASFLYEHVVVE